MFRVCSHTARNASVDLQAVPSTAWSVVRLVHLRAFSLYLSQSPPEDDACTNCCSATAIFAGWASAINADR